jgi:alkylhydroperoxidase family enzyme
MTDPSRAGALPSGTAHATPKSRPLGAPAWTVRTILGVLGGVQLANGVWASLAPRSFYGEFPFGRGWVEALPAYNEHLMRDVGTLFLATGFVLLAAAWFLGRRLVAIALVSYLLFSVPHAAYHMLNLGPYGAADAIANAAVLALTVLAPAAILVALARAPRDRVPQAAVAGGGNGRIEGVSEGTRRPLARFAYRYSRRRFGAVMDPLRLYAHHPAVMIGYALHEVAAERSHRVSGRLKHLAALRTGMIAGCEWCCDFGSAISAASDVSTDDMRALPTYRRSDRFTELESLVLDYATGMSRTPVEVSDELFDRLREHLDEPQLVELTDIIALENYRARFNWAFGLTGQGFSEGSFCVRPESALPERPAPAAT